MAVAVVSWLEALRRRAGRALDRWLPAQQVVLEVTRHCDRHCAFCYRRPEDFAQPGFMTPETARLVLGRVRDHFGRVRVAISGGEPLLNPDLDRVVEVALTFDGETRMLTNLGLLTPERAERLRRLGLKNLQFTFLSLVPDEHDALRGAGDFARTVAGMQVARAAGFALAAILVTTARNLDHVTASLEFLTAMGVTALMVNRYNAGFPEAGGRDLFVARARLAPWLDELEAFGRRTGITLAFGVPLPLCALPPGDRPHLRLAPCPIGFGHGEYWGIDPEGRVRPCNHYPHPLGDLTRQSVGELLACEAWQAVVAAFRTPPAFCAGCPLFAACRAGCRAAALTWTNNLANADPWIAALGVTRDSSTAR